jgi:hypothetical protein
MSVRVFHLAGKSVHRVSTVVILCCYVLGCANDDSGGAICSGEKDFAQHRTDASSELRLVQSQNGFVAALRRVEKSAAAAVPRVLCPRCQVAGFLNDAQGRDEKDRAAAAYSWERFALGQLYRNGSPIWRAWSKTLGLGPAALGSGTDLKVTESPSIKVPKRVSGKTPTTERLDRCVCRKLSSLFRLVRSRSRERIRSKLTCLFPSRKSWLMELPALDSESKDAEAPGQRGHCAASFTF